MRSRSSAVIFFLFFFCKISLVFAQDVPSKFIGNRIIVTPTTKSGEKLNLLADTGGGGSSGMYWINQSAASRLDLSAMSCHVGGYSLSTYSLPNFHATEALPAPIGPCQSVIVLNAEVSSASDSIRFDGLIGAAYLSKGIWTFDYVAHRLTHQPNSWSPRASDKRANAGFAMSSSGKLLIGYARLTVDIAGRPYNMLLDTGATARPTSQGIQSGYDCASHTTCAASYITTETLNEWLKLHPDWKVVRNADSLLPALNSVRAIRVPDVKISGFSTGPVWFTERPNSALHGFISEWTDQVVDGAIGGNALRGLDITIDYPDCSVWISQN